MTDERLDDMERSIWQMIGATQERHRRELEPLFAELARVKAMREPRLTITRESIAGMPISIARLIR